MARLFKVDSNGELLKAEEKPFRNEVNEMEPFVKRNIGILGDVFIFAEQPTPSGTNRHTEFIAVNKDGKILIIELKIKQVGTEILEQVLSYKLHWRQSPESAKSLWQQAKNKPEGMEPDWENYDPEIVIIAPSFDRNLLDINADSKLGLRFVQIARYGDKSSTFIVLDEPEVIEKKATLSHAQQEYDWNWYSGQKIADANQIKIAQVLNEKILTISNEKGWDIHTKFNKNYVSFKLGGHNFIWLEFLHRKKVALSLNLKDEKSNLINNSKIKWLWNKNWNFWYTEIDNPDFDLTHVIEILSAIYLDIKKF